MIPWDNIKPETKLSQYGAAMRDFWQAFRTELGKAVQDDGTPYKISETLAIRADELKDGGISSLSGTVRAFASASIQGKQFAKETLRAEHFVPGSIPGDRFTDDTYFEVSGQVPGGAFGEVHGDRFAPSALTSEALAVHTLHGGHLTVRGSSRQILGESGRTYTFDDIFDVDADGRVTVDLGSSNSFAVFDEVNEVANPYITHVSGTPHLRPHVRAGPPVTIVTRWKPVAGFGFTFLDLEERQMEFPTFGPATSRSECFCCAYRYNLRTGAPAGIYFLQAGVYKVFLLFTAARHSTQQVLHMLPRVTVYPRGVPPAGSGEVPPRYFFYLDQRKEGYDACFFAVTTVVFNADPENTYERNPPWDFPSLIPEVTASGSENYYPYMWSTNPPAAEVYDHMHQLFINKYQLPNVPSTPVLAGMRAVVIKLR